MADNDFIETIFDPFFLKLAIINCKIKSKVDLKAKELQCLEVLSELIPAFNKINDMETDKDKGLDESISSLKEETSSSKSLFENYKSKNRGDSEDLWSKYSFPNNGSDIKKEGLNNEPSEEKDEPDEEGDLEVENLTKRALSYLKYMKKRKWVSMLSDSSDSDSDDDDSDS